MTVLERIRVHPIKSLDATSVETAKIVANGGLDWDRRYAIVEATDRTETADDAPYVNGKRESQIHLLAVGYDLERATVTVRDRDDDDEATTFHLERDRDELAGWLSDRLGYPVEVVRDGEGGFPDDTDASGPTVISSGTLEAVASWYDGIDAAEMCRRLRPNLVVGDVPAFWEDRLYETPGRVVPFTVGETSFEGVNPCQRCVVPTRDPDTGEETDGFRERFVERREATLPAWASEAWFDHYFRLMVNTRVPESAWGATLSVGDGVAVDDSLSNR
ncbi:MULTISPECIES: MOSC domain-containing protein [Natrialbaceae]|uniref:MOSC domain-containing protein n=1 Tax=Natrialbaceae TaxID=1644061 RepID=UPI00207D5315|nr:MOSC N-terminal beta barrel domain-containing protein [Natronococcus sp. CG52]